MSETAILLEAIGWTNGELAARLGVNETTVRSWRSGRRQTPGNVLTWLRLIRAGIEAAGRPPAKWTVHTPAS